MLGRGRQTERQSQMAQLEQQAYQNTPAILFLQLVLDILAFFFFLSPHFSNAGTPTHINIKGLNFSKYIHVDLASNIHLWLHISKFSSLYMASLTSSRN